MNRCAMEGIDNDPEEARADELLHVYMGKGCGIYAERQLRRHRRREFSNTQHDEASLMMDLVQRELLTMMESDLRELGRLAKLNEYQSMVWSYFLDGVPEVEIARLLDVSRQAISQTIQRCRMRVEFAMAGHPLYGLWEVYWQLVKRGKKKL